ncbi:Monocarboxylate transporter 1 [Crotalus adamanteus]|uniref:Monocarboxylate transporter 1 n=1 Tax=Crotalus adamanteus TaxID=8729 RepID=A0AAW1BS66_CROAD
MTREGKLRAESVVLPGLLKSLLPASPPRCLSPMGDEPTAEKACVRGRERLRIKGWRATGGERRRVSGSLLATDFKYLLNYFSQDAASNWRSIFFKEIEIIFEASSSKVSWISSIMLAVMYAGGPISSVLVNKYGSRPVMIAGGCLSGCGLIGASFCNTVEELYFCVGVVGGLGLAFNLNPALTMIGKYFFKKRPLANGLAMAGSPVFLFGAQRFSSAVGLVTIVECGPVLLGPPVLGKLNDVYGDYKYTYWACGLILIFSGIFLFIGMGINYRLVAKEQEAMDKQTAEGKEEETNIDEAEKQKESNKAVKLPPKTTEDSRV